MRQASGTDLANLILRAAIGKAWSFPSKQGTPRSSSGTEAKKSSNAHQKLDAEVAI